MFSLLIVLAAASQLGAGAPIVVDRVQATKVADSARRLAISVKSLQEFELEKLSSVPVTHYITQIFDTLASIQDINTAEAIEKLRGETFSRLAEIHRSSKLHAERLGLFINLLNENAAQFEEVESFEVATYIQEIGELFSELSDDLFDIIIGVETQISVTQIDVNNLITVNNYDSHYYPQVIEVRKTMALLNEMYATGNNQLVGVLHALEENSNDLLFQLKLLLGDQAPDTASLSMWQRTHVNKFKTNMVLTPVCHMRYTPLK